MFVHFLFRPNFFHDSNISLYVGGTWSFLTLNRGVDRIWDALKVWWKFPIKDLTGGELSAWSLAFLEIFLVPWYLGTAVLHLQLKIRCVQALFLFRTLKIKFINSRSAFFSHCKGNFLPLFLRILSCFPVAASALLISQPGQYSANYSSFTYNCYVSLFPHVQAFNNFCHYWILV